MISIECRDVWKSFYSKSVLRGVNLNIRAGETLVIMGQSGSGKSVLLKHFVGLIEPDGPRVALTLPRYPVVEPGHRAEVAGSLRPPPDDGYGEYLRRIGVTGTLRSRGLEIVGERDGPVRALEALRRATGNALAAALPEPEAGLAAGILVGLRDRVDRDLAADFTTAGVSHVVAISG